MKLTRLLASSVTILLAFGVAGSQSSAIVGSAFDWFGDVNCESEMARLDSLAVTLQSSPNDIAAIIFYGGQRFRGRLPKRGEAAVRAARLKTYLVSRRGIPAERIQLIDGGFMKEWYAHVWIVPPGAEMPKPNLMIPIQQIKFRKGTAQPRDFRCQI